MTVRDSAASPPPQPSPTRGEGEYPGMTHDDVLNRLRQKFGADGFTTSEFRDNRRVVVATDRLYPVLEFLKEECGFDMLAELTAVDYLRYPEARDRFGVIYLLLDTVTGLRIFVKTYVNEP